MRKLICILLLLLFAGHHGLSANNFSFSDLETRVEAALDTGGQDSLRAFKRCCGDDAQQSTTGSTTPCSSDCSFTSAQFDLVFKSHQQVPAYELANNINAAFRHALFRPPIA